MPPVQDRYQYAGEPELGTPGGRSGSSGPPGPDRAFIDAYLRCVEGWHNPQRVAPSVPYVPTEVPPPVVRAGSGHKPPIFDPHGPERYIPPRVIRPSPRVQPQTCYPESYPDPNYPYNPGHPNYPRETYPPPCPYPEATYPPGHYPPGHYPPTNVRNPRLVYPGGGTCYPRPRETYPNPGGGTCYPRPRDNFPGSCPTDYYPPGSYPPGSYPSDYLPPGIPPGLLPPGLVRPDIYQPGMYPPGTHPSDYYPPGTCHPGTRYPNNYPRPGDYYPRPGVNVRIPGVGGCFPGGGGAVDLNLRNFQIRIPIGNPSFPGVQPMRLGGCGGDPFRHYDQHRYPTIPRPRNSSYRR